MRKHTGLALAAGFVLLGLGETGIASAADMPLKARPAPAPMVAIYNWTGWYIGLNAGGGWSDSRVNVGFNDPAFFGPAFAAGATPSSYSTRPSGFLGGAQVGYNWQASNFVFGLEADIDGADIHGSQTINTTVAPFVPGFGSASQRLDWLATVRGRAGFLAAPTLLLYATGGLAAGEFKNNYSFAFPATGELYTVSARETRAGWTAGAGAEWGFAPNWSAKLEYLFFDLGNRTYAATAVGAPAGSTHIVSFKENGNIVRVGINYHFGAPVVAKY
jgi:outer membrane immunogenic protein